MAAIAVNYSCSIPGCGRNGYAKNVCQFHYDRKRRLGSYDRPCKSCGSDLGSALGNVKYCSDQCVPVCQVNMCHGKIVDKKGYCRYHNLNVWRHGTVTPGYTWAEKTERCQICEKPIEGFTRRRGFCGTSCYERSRRYGISSSDASFECHKCGSIVEVDLTIEGTRLGRTLCSSCADYKYRPGWKKARQTFVESADRSCCGLCGREIDYGLRWPDPMSPTVDHIVPYSLGGSNEMDNLQWAHAFCNVSKGNRTVVEDREGAIA